MKILLLNSICGHGSTGRIVSDLWKTLKKEGHQVKVAFGLGEGKDVDIEDCICYNNKFGYYLHNIAAKITDRTGLYSTPQTKRLIKEIKNYNPDIIHIHQLHGYHINYKILFKYLAQAEIKIIWTLHDCWAFTGHCAHFSFNKCEKWKSGCKDCDYVKEYPSCYLLGASEQNYNTKKERFTSVKNMTIVTPSEWLADIVKQSFLGKYPVKVINNGIDTAVFKPVESNFKEKHNIQNKKIVLAVANVWNKKKGYYDVLKLTDLLDENYKVVIVGLTEEQKEKLPDNILGITRTNNVHELRELYSAAYVFVNFTYEDTYPTVNLEAICCGTPVVTYKTGGSTEIVQKTKYGYICEQGDILGVHKAVKECITLSKHTVENYSIQQSGKEYLDLYKEIVK